MHWVRLLPWRWQLRRAGYRLANPRLGYRTQHGRQYTYHLDSVRAARRQVVLTMVQDSRSMPVPRGTRWQVEAEVYNASWYPHDTRLAYSRTRLAALLRGSLA